MAHGDTLYFAYMQVFVSLHKESWWLLINLHHPQNVELPGSYPLITILTSTGLRGGRIGSEGVCLASCWPFSGLDGGDALECL